MASRTSEITQAIAEHLNAQTVGGIEFTATSIVSEYIFQEDMEGIVVTVYPVSFTYTQDTRSTYLYTHEIGVTLAQGVVSEDAGDQDKIIELAETLPRSLFNIPMAGAHYRTVNDGNSISQFDVAELEQGSLMVAHLNVYYLDYVAIGA
ncbi:MAG: hypothetical protein GY753_02095 [Gammaproteobacteria bacterium]|nr:hypothetical protein [Gammaproteobacteria bacterium]